MTPCNSTSWSYQKHITSRNVQKVLYASQSARTYPFVQQLLAGILQAFPTLFYAPPLFQHARNLGVDLVDAADQPVAHVEVFRYAQEVLPEVSLLTMRHRAVNQSEPVVKLLRCLDRLFWMERVRVRSGWWMRTRGGGT
jgi:hypothetical protein